MESFLSQTYTILLCFMICSGCFPAQETPQPQAHTKEAAVEEVQNILDAEYQALFKEDIAAFPLKSDVFEVSAAAFLSDPIRLGLEITVDKPKQFMKNVIIFGALDQKAWNSLNAPFLTITNITQMEADPSGQSAEHFTIGPDIQKIKGISVSTFFLLNEGVRLEDVRKDSSFIYVKVSWLNEKDEQQVQYLKIPSEQIEVKANDSELLSS